MERRHGAARVLLNRFAATVQAQKLVAEILGASRLYRAHLAAHGGLGKIIKTLNYQ
jgi:hypothetical protein